VVESDNMVSLAGQNVPQAPKVYLSLGELPPLGHGINPYRGRIIKNYASGGIQGQRRLEKGSTGRLKEFEAMLPPRKV
jgi:hypothetical protein